MHLYGSNLPSGNVYKVQLLLTQLNIKFDETLLDLTRQPPESREAKFLQLNPNGRIPTLVLDDGTPLPESNAILFFLAEDTQYLPENKLERAQVLQWLFFEQYSHEPYVATWKYRTYWAHQGFSDLTEREIKNIKVRGQAAIDVMEKHLDGKQWFVGGKYSIADIALFAYSSAAEQVGFQVGPNVQAWLERVRQTERFVRIAKDPTGKNPY